MYVSNPVHTRAYEQAAATFDRLDSLGFTPFEPQPKTLPAPDPERPWAPGAEWGQSRRVRPVNGIHWEMLCPCGQKFTVSTNDTTLECRRKCPTCIDRESIAEAAERLKSLVDAADSGKLQIVVGGYVQAHAMWEKYHKYVRSRVWAEIRPYVGGKEYGLLDDVEHAVWEKVAEKIESFRGCDGSADRRAEMSWLKLVVRSVVTDHFRFEYRKKQDQRKTVSIPGDDSREMASDRSYLPAKATANADYLNGDSDRNDEDTGGAVVAGKAEYDASLTQEWRRAGLS